MLADLPVRRVERSRLGEVDFANLGFGDVYSDHMFSMVFEDGRWQRPEIVPYGPIALDPAAASLHYAQAVFEGMKAFRGGDGTVRLFRPERNAERLLESCERMCVPAIEPELFVAAIERLVALDAAWIPDRRGQSLYVRPIIFSTEPHMEVRPSRRFRFLIITAPVRAYFDSGMKALSLKVEDEFTRSAPGGTGFAKCSGNYAASLYPAERAREEGCVQVLWLDGLEHRYVEEVGAMNIFFRIDDRIVTPELRGTILPGVTRECAIDLLRDAGHEVEERRIPITEIVEAARAGRLQEAFGAGTAAVISPVGRLSYRGDVVSTAVNDAGPVTTWLYDEITGIQLGEREDRRGWNRVVPIETPAPA